jgi:hypothetical protein
MVVGIWCSSSLAAPQPTPIPPKKPRGRRHFSRFNTWQDVKRVAGEALGRERGPRGELSEANCVRVIAALVESASRAKQRRAVANARLLGGLAAGLGAGVG